MKSVIWLPLSCALVLCLNSCSNTGSTAGNDPLGTGPFDSQGRYREEWADDPSKWSKPGKRQPNIPPADDLPAIAKNEEPPPNANPLAPKPITVTKSRTESAPRETSRPRETVKRTDDEPKVVSSKPKPKSTVSTKPKSKPKPKSSRYIVKSGDSLSRIASRNGSSVSAIQKANGISGTLIHPGQSLIIPKR